MNEAIVHLAERVDSDEAQELLDAMEHGVDQRRIDKATRAFLETELQRGALDRTQIRDLTTTSEDSILDAAIKDLVKIADTPDGDEETPLEEPDDFESESDEG